MFPCPAWCTSCDRTSDTDGSIYHRTTRSRELVEVDVCQVWEGPTRQATPLEVQVHVYDEPPLTLEQARQVGHRYLVVESSGRP